MCNWLPFKETRYSVYYMPHCSYKEEGVQFWHEPLRGYLVLDDAIDFRQITDREIAKIPFYPNKLFLPFVHQGFLVQGFLILQPWLMMKIITVMKGHGLIDPSEIPSNFFNIPTLDELEWGGMPESDLDKLKEYIDWFLEKTDKYFHVSWYVYKRQLLATIRYWKYDDLRFYLCNVVPEQNMEAEVIKQFLHADPSVIKMSLYMLQPPGDELYQKFRNDAITQPVGVEPLYSQIVDELNKFGVIDEIRESIKQRRTEILQELNQYFLTCHWSELGFPVSDARPEQLEKIFAASLLMGQPYLLEKCISFAHLSFLRYPEALVAYTEDTPFTPEFLEGVLWLLEGKARDWRMMRWILDQVKKQKNLLECMLNISLGNRRVPSAVRSLMQTTRDPDPNILREIMITLQTLENNSSNEPALPRPSDPGCTTAGISARRLSDGCSAPEPASLRT